MSLLGRIYVLVAVTIFVVLGSWALWTLRENANLVEVVILVPEFDLKAPSSRNIVELSVGALLSGWLVAGAVLLLVAARAPYRIRAAAKRLRKIRELEQEVKTLRILPLRQQEEDELLAQEARLDLHERRVMTSQAEVSTDYARETADALGEIRWVRPSSNPQPHSATAPSSTKGPEN